MPKQVNNTTKKTVAKKAAPRKTTIKVAPIPIDTTKDAIYGAMAAVMDQVNAIGKDSTNKQGWNYRGIDAAYNEIHPLLANNRIVTVPRVKGLIGRFTVPTKMGGTMNYTMLSCEFDFVCTIDGSKVTVGPIFGEGMDAGDKSTAKALSICHKYAIFMTWCIPTSDMPEGDADSHDVIMPAATLMPMNPASPTPTLVPMNPVAPDIMPQPPAVDVPIPATPATNSPSLMPQVTVNTTVAPIAPPPPTKKSVPAPVTPPMDDGLVNDGIVIEDEPSAIVSADMLINMVVGHSETMAALQEFWHLNQAVLKVLNQNFPSQYKRVADTFAGLKANLQPTQE